MQRLEQINFLFPFCLFLYLVSSFNVGVAEENPFTPKAFLIRYWTKQVSNDLPKPLFLLNKASPLSAVESATFTKLATQNALSTHLSKFCSSAKLLCFPDSSPILEKHDEQNYEFVLYQNKNFTNYGTSQLGRVDSFKNYSDGEGLAVNSFRRYSRDSTGNGDEFSNYAPDGNLADQRFNTYGAGANAGAGAFKSYGQFVNIPHLGFTSYSDKGNGRKQAFSTYVADANSGDESFSNYGKNGNGEANEFSGYGEDTNVIGSSFSSYSQTGNGGKDLFSSYGSDGNVPQNNFKNYGSGGNAAIEDFSNYRDDSNVGDDSFKSYIKNSNGGKVNFKNYGQSFNGGTDKFSGYGHGASGQSVGLKLYGFNTTFKDYAKHGVTFSNYMNESSTKFSSSNVASGKMVNRWVEPGKFFRESMLKSGTIMAMPDVTDKMPHRSFLPRAILSKLPFSTSKFSELKQIFHIKENSTMESILTDALSECERAPSRGETKRCVGSGEDMIDFAVSVLGRNVMVRSTENTHGSKQNVTIGKVKGINGGEVTESVSCHQSLFPYLLYYCHSVPKVRVYEADLLDPETGAKINHGVAICHLDTSDWSPGHGAFLALGSSPGKIEVCHWIFENDMTWTIAD